MGRLEIVYAVGKALAYFISSPRPSCQTKHGLGPTLARRILSTALEGIPNLWLSRRGPSPVAMKMAMTIAGSCFLVVSQGCSNLTLHCRFAKTCRAPTLRTALFFRRKMRPQPQAQVSNMVRASWRHARHSPLILSWSIFFPQAAQAG